MDPRIPWIRPSKEPYGPIGSRSAREQIVKRVFGTQLVGFDPKRFPGGFTRKIEVPKELRAEMAIAEGTHTAAYEWADDWLIKVLGITELELVRVAIRDPQAPIVGRLTIDACRSDFWRSCDPAYVLLQRLLIARDRDPSGTWEYSLNDGQVFTALLDATPRRRRVRNREVKELIAEGLRLVNSGEETMLSAAKLIAKSKWRQDLAVSEDALVDQIRRGISAERKVRNAQYGTQVV